MPFASRADFEAHVGHSFDLDGGIATLTLTKVDALPSSPRDGGGFRLEFGGAGAPLPQRIYAFDRAGDRLDIFIVPIAHDGDTTRYEAVFN